MNKFFFRLIVIGTFLIATTLNLNAQWFLGGEVGVSVDNVSIDSLSGHVGAVDRTVIGFNISPKAGYYFNEKFAVGLNLSVGGTFELDASNRNNNEQRYQVNWRIDPIVKYSIFTYKKFSLVLEGKIGIGSTYYFYKSGDNNIEKGLTVLSIGVFNVAPILGFKLTEHLQLEAGLHFLNLGYNINIGKASPEGLSYHNTDYIEHDFNIGFNSSSILRMSQLTIGVIYKF